MMRRLKLGVEIFSNVVIQALFTVITLMKTEQSLTNVFYCSVKTTKLILADIAI